MKKISKFLVPLGTLFAICSTASTIVSCNNKKNASNVSVIEKIKSQIQTTKKTQLAFNGIDVNKEHPITNYYELYNVLGIKVDDVPDNYKVQIWKDSFSNLINVKLTDSRTFSTYSFQSQVKKFAEPKEIDKLLETIASNLQEMTIQSKLDSYETSLLETELETPLVKANFIQEVQKILETQKLQEYYSSPTYQLSDEFIHKSKYWLDISPNAPLWKNLSKLQGYKKIKIKKDFEDNKISFELFVHPDDLKDYYRLKIRTEIKHTAHVIKTNDSEKLNTEFQDLLWLSILAKSKKNLNSFLPTYTYYKRKTDNKISYDNAVKKDSIGLTLPNSFKSFISNYQITVQYLKSENDLELSIFQKKVGTNDEFIERQVKLFGQYNGIVKSDINGIPDAVLNHKNKNQLFIFARGGKIDIITEETGEKIPGWTSTTLSKYQTDEKPSSPIIPANNENKIIVAGGSENDKGYFHQLSVEHFFGNKSNAGSELAIALPDANLVNHKCESKFLLPKVNNEVYVIFADLDNHKIYYTTWDWSLKTLVKKIKELEVPNIADDAILYNKHNVNAGYLFAVNDVSPSGKAVGRIYHFDKDMKYDSMFWKVPTVEWEIAKIIADQKRNGYWLLGKRGQIVLINNKGEIKSDIFINQESVTANAVVVNKDGNLIVGYDEGIIEVINFDGKKLNVIKGKEMLFGGDIKHIKMDDKGFLYLVGSKEKMVNSKKVTYLLIEKLTSNLDDVWKPNKPLIEEILS